MNLRVSHFISVLKREWTIIVILIIAAFLRLYKIDQYMTFLGDEGRDAITVYNILHGHFTLLGPTASVGGFFMGPIYYYLCAPFFFLLGMSPVGSSVMVSLFSVAAIYLMYKIGSEFFNKTTAFIAAILYTISPMVIVYSRSSWNPNIMPFFSLVTIYVLYQALKNKNKWLFVFVGILFGIDIQLHYIELALGLTIIFYDIFIRFAKKSSNFFTTFFQIIKDGLLIFVGFLVGFSPFLAFEFRHNFENSSNIINFIFHSGNTGTNSNFLINIYDVFFRIFGRVVVHFPPPEQFPIIGKTIIISWYIGVLVLAVMSAVTLFITYKKTWIKKDIKFYQISLIVFWFVIGILFFGFYKKPIYDYYFEFMFPLPFLLVGNLFSNLWNKKMIFKAIAAIGLVWLLVVNLKALPVLDDANNQYVQAKSIAQFILQKSDNKPFNFALITGGNSDYAYRYFFLREKRGSVVIQNPNIDPKRLTVTKQLFVVCESWPCFPLGHSLWEIAGFGRAEIDNYWDLQVVKIYRLVHYKS